jgi:two-component system, chemotaxis family, sensor kinase Cph1
MSASHPTPYSIKRHGTNVRDCEAEPIQAPGCIQRHGVLIALRETLAALEASLKTKGAQIIILRPLPRIRCDRVRVREVFSNLIANALVFNDSDVAHVEIGHLERGEQPPDWWSWSPEASKIWGLVFYVRDNGIGIEPRHHEQIFGMFNRLHPHDAYGGGAGAGLAVTRKLIEQQGGSIWVDSRLGEGATFLFTLTPAT